MTKNSLFFLKLVLLFSVTSVHGMDRPRQTELNYLKSLLQGYQNMNEDTFNRIVRGATERELANARDRREDAHYITPREIYILTIQAEIRKLELQEFVYNLNSKNGKL